MARKPAITLSNSAGSRRARARVIALCIPATTCSASASAPFGAAKDDHVAEMALVAVRGPGA